MSKYSAKAILLLSFILLGIKGQSQTQSLPVVFERNHGQAGRDTQFLSRASGSTLYFGAGKLEIVRESEHGGTPLQMIFGHGDSPTGSGRTSLVNYYPDNHQSRWITGIPAYEAIRYKELYRGIDLVFHGTGGELEFDFEVAPHADPNVIRLHFKGGKVEISDGELVVGGPKGLKFHAPTVYQFVAGKRRVIPGAFLRTSDDEIGFTIGEYDRSKPLVIDPVLSYATYFATVGTTVKGMTVDQDGNVILVGTTNSASFPVTPDAVSDVLPGLSAAFVTKLDSTGTHLIYSTYFGGQNGTTANAVAVDAAGSAYVVGFASQGMPVLNAYLSSCATDCQSAFAAKFSTSGALQYSTYLTTSAGNARAVAIDSTGNALVTGAVYEATLPLLNPFQTRPTVPFGTNAMFLQKLSADGSSLLFSTYVGDRGSNTGVGVGVDSGDNVYVLSYGSTHVPKFLTGDEMVNLLKFTPDGQSLLRATSLQGTAAYESIPTGLAVNEEGNSYISGWTHWMDFPFSPNAYNPVCTGDPAFGVCREQQAFVSAFGSNGEMIYSTFLGRGSASSIAADQAGNAYVAGTAGPGFPQVSPVLDISGYGGAFVAKISPSGSPIYIDELSGYFTSEQGLAAGQHDGDAYVSGLVTYNALASWQSITPDYPSVNPLQNVDCCTADILFVARVSEASGPMLSVSPLRTPLIVLRNVGSAPMIVSSVTVTSPSFEKAGDCNAPLTLSPGRDCVLSLRLLVDGATAGVSISTNADPAPRNFIVNQRSVGIPMRSGIFLVDPLYVNIGYLRSGQTRSGTIRIRNVGFIAETLSVTSRGSVSFTNHCPGSVAAGTTCTLDYTASGDGSIDIGGYHTFNVTALPLARSLVTLPQTLNFGSQFAGSPASKVLVVRNLDTVPVDITGLTITGAYTFSSDCPATVAAGASCQIAVTFGPTTNRYEAGILTINNSGGGGAIQVTLGGRGYVRSVLELSTAELLFSQTIQGQQTGSVTITNAVDYPVQISGLNVSEPYSVQSDCAGTLAGGATCTASVVFSPTIAGAYESVLSIVNGDGPAQELLLHGQATNPVTPSATSLDFSEQPKGVSSDEKVLTLYSRNSGTTTALSLTGSDFSVRSGCASEILPYTSCPVYVSFDPVALGPRQETLTITTNNPASSQQVVLKGIGVVAGSLTLSSTKLNFGTVAPNESKTLILTVTNQGPGDVSIGMPELVSPQSSAWYYPYPFPSRATRGVPSAPSSIPPQPSLFFALNTSDCPTTLVPGANCHISVSFSPKDLGSWSGTLTLRDNAPGRPHVIPMTGIAAVKATPSRPTIRAARRTTQSIQRIKNEIRRNPVAGTDR